MIIANAKDQALFLYGFDVDQFNRYIPFKISGGGSELVAQMTPGNYTATTFMAEFKRAIGAADLSNTYTVSMDRTTNGGTSNRITVSTSGAFLSILFLTGSTALNSPRVLAGFDAVDYTGSTSYTGSTNAGKILIPDYPTYEYHGPKQMTKYDGTKNVSSFGVKETLVYSKQQFLSGEWQWITDEFGKTQETQWEAFLDYAVQQKALEFTPSINEDPSSFYEVTLETTASDGNGMGYELKKMTSLKLFRVYRTGTLKFRLIVR